MSSILHMATHRGRPLRIGNRSIIPVARSIEIAIYRPGFPFGGRLVWTLPSAVEVVGESGTQIIPIPNYMLWIEVGLLAAGILSLLGRLLRR